MTQTTTNYYSCGYRATPESRKTYSAIKYLLSSDVPIVRHEKSRNVCFKLVGQKKYSNTHSVTTILSFGVCVLAVALALHGMPLEMLCNRQIP